MKTTLKTEKSVKTFCEGLVTYESGGNNLEEVILS